MDVGGGDSRLRALTACEPVSLGGRFHLALEGVTEAARLPVPAAGLVFRRTEPFLAVPVFLAPARPFPVFPAPPELAPPPVLPAAFRRLAIRRLEASLEACFPAEREAA